jgi:hypothetical protein
MLVPGDIKGFDTGFDHGIGFDGLLVETGSGSAFFIPSVAADGHKVIVFGLDGKQPLEGDLSPISIMSLRCIRWPDSSRAWGSLPLA